MATQNRPTPKRRPAAEETRPAAPAPAEAEETNGETDQDAARTYINRREGTRRIKLHQKRRIMSSTDEAVVKTVGGAPDMRFAENRLGLMRDPSKKKSGEEDFRFVENRPDILAIHAERGDHFPNLLFDENGHIEAAGEEVEAGETL